MTSSALNHKVKIIANELSNKQELIYYTDGSLKQEQPFELNGFTGDPLTFIGAAFVLKY